MVGTPCHRFKLTNNIFGFGQYGPGIDGGQNTFAEAFPGGVFEKNLLVGHGEGRAEHAMKNKNFPAGFLFEPQHVGTSPQDDADWAAVGFLDFAGGDYRLTESSKYRAGGSDGKARAPTSMPLWRQGRAGPGRQRTSFDRFGLMNSERPATR